MVSVILLLAGSASRMNLGINKVFLPLGNKPMFMHCYDKFNRFGWEIIFVIKKEEEELVKKYAPDAKIAYGGETRQESVYSGLLIAQSEYCLIHDAARPLISEEIIANCFNELKENNIILTAIQPKDTIYYSNKPLNRDDILLAQTPQGGPRKDLLYCHEMATKNKVIFTDDISLVLKYLKRPLKIINGSYNNIKITTEIDYKIAKELIIND